TGEGFHPCRLDLYPQGRRSAVPCLAVQGGQPPWLPSPARPASHRSAVTHEIAHAISGLIRLQARPRKFSPCTERIVDMNLASTGMRPSCDTDSIRFVALWPQARQKGVEKLLSRLSCLRPLR